MQPRLFRFSLSMVAIESLLTVAACSNGATGNGGMTTPDDGGGTTSPNDSAGTVGPFSDAPAGCSGSVYAFCDDFEDGNANGWTQMEQSGSTPGNWMVASDTGHDGAPTHDFRQTATTTGYHYQYPSAASGGPWADQTVTAWLKLTAPIGDDNTKVGVCARVTSTSATNSLSGYCVFLRADGAGGGKVQVSKKVSGSSMASQTTSTTNVPSFAVGTWYKVTVKAIGTSPVTISGLVNDVPLILWQDDTTDAGAPLMSGYPAIVTRAASTMPATANFDDVSVTAQ
jgi:hypothetical protein